MRGNRFLPSFAPFGGKQQKPIMTGAVTKFATSYGEFGPGVKEEEEDTEGEKEKETRRSISKTEKQKNEENQEKGAI